MNTDKSNIIFSPNVLESVRGNIMQLMGVATAINPGTYLGIHSLWGKPRCGALGYVKEMVDKKIKC